MSAVGLGTWNIGGSWGDVSDETGRDVVRAALEAEIDFIDTADVYGDGRSERHVGRVLDERDAPDDVFVATKAGRRLDPHKAVSTVIPGTTSPDHVRSNAAVSGLGSLSNRAHGAARDVYEEYVAEHYTTAGNAAVTCRAGSVSGRAC